MRTHGRQSGHEHRAITEFIERMFSGFVLDYDNAAAKNRGEPVAVVVSGAAPRQTPGAKLAAIRQLGSAPLPVEVLETITGPRVYPLPNSPTGWNEARLGVRVAYGDHPHDPAQPAGLIEDALGLGTDDDRR
jgi:hypothetical protein